MPGNERISALLRFLVCADYIDLLGPVEVVLMEIKTLLQGMYSVSCEQVRIAAVFPRGHAARKLIAENCVPHYAGTLFRRQPLEFKYRREMVQLDGFAADLLRAFTKASKRLARSGAFDGNLEFRNPY